jgi:hypothetical protein
VLPVLAGNELAASSDAVDLATSELVDDGDNLHCEEVWLQLKFELPPQLQCTRGPESLRIAHSTWSRSVTRSGATTHDHHVQ